MRHFKTTPTSAFIFYRSYSRWSGKARESWMAMVDRCVTGLAELGKLTGDEIDLLRDEFDNSTALPSGRYMWCGGTDWSSKQQNYEGSYNCAGHVVDDINVFGRIMDLSMKGSGCGAVLELDAIAKLPPIKTKLNIELVDEIGTAPSDNREQETRSRIYGDTIELVVGDSRRGWVESYVGLIQLAVSDVPGGELTVRVHLSNVRPTGERLSGFGGTANPSKLPELYGKVAAILNGAIGRQLNSIECCKLIDEAAIVVVAGNIRRCIAYGERVSAFGGMKQIQNISVGDMVLASDGRYHAVTDKFDQGVQKTLNIKTQLSSLSVTPNHRLAVMDKLNNYKWVEAKDLVIGDILVSTPHTKGVDTITTDEAWLIGTYIADGHTDIESALRRNGGGGNTVFAMSTTSLDTVGAKIAKCLFGKGYTPTIRSKGNSSSMTVYRKDLAEYFRQFKAPWGTPTIPDAVWHGSPQVRGAFLAGLWDGDGDDRAVLNNTKIDFLAEVQKLYLSLGIAVNLNIRKDKIVKGSTYEGCHNLTVVGQQSKLVLKALVAPFMVRINYTPCGMNRSNLRLPKFFSTKHMHGKAGHNWDGFVADGIADASLIPCPIVSISEGDEVHTYDIEVADVHEFIVNGLLSHNSAGIRQFSADDTLALTAKDDLWQQGDDGKWRINPERDALRMANHTRVFHTKPTLAECIDSVRKQYHSGEGAIQWAGEAVARANADLLDTPDKKAVFLGLYPNRELAKDWMCKLSGNTEDEFILDHRMGRYNLNPCGEIISKDFVCNLAEVHLNTIDPFDFDAQVSAFKAASLSVAALLHHEFEIPRYQKSRELDPIVGVSFTGLFDFFVHLFGIEWLKWWQAGRPQFWGPPTDVRCDSRLRELVEADFIRQFHFDSLSQMFIAIEEEYLESWKAIVFDTVTEYCERHGLKVPNRCTTVQPAGCLTVDAVRVSSIGLFYADELMDDGIGDCEFTEFEVRDGLTTKSGISNPMRNDLIEITLSHGRKVTATPCHRFSINGEWVRADEITEGSLLDFEVGQYINAIEPALEYLCTPTTIGRGRQPLGCQMPEYMSPDLAYFVGAVFGNGCFASSYRIRISHGRMDVLMKLRDIGTRLFGLQGVVTHDSRGGRNEICFANKQLFEWFKLNNLDKTVKSVDLDRFPVTIRTSSRDSIIAFFAGLVDTDGCIRSNGTLSIDMATESFIRNAQQIGEAVGLVFGISHNTQGSNLQLEKSIWSLSLSKCVSDPESIKKLNQFSLKAIDRPLRISHKTNGKKPFIVTDIEHNQSGYTYDITIDTDDDNEAWYWHGALKSHNSKSLLTGASPGWSPPKASRYIRRMTFGKGEPIALAAIDMGYSVIPSQSDKDENGNLLDDIHDPRVTEWLVEIPCATSWADMPGVDAIDISQFSALAQFDFYMQVQRYYSTHTTSATIELREHEIEPLATAIYEDIQNDGGYMSAALLARFDSLETFPRMPFEPISKDVYDDALVAIAMRRVESDFDVALAKHDRGQTAESGPSGCDSDKCLIGGDRR